MRLAAENKPLRDLLGRRVSVEYEIDIGKHALPHERKVRYEGTVVAVTEHLQKVRIGFIQFIYGDRYFGDEDDVYASRARIEVIK